MNKKILLALVVTVVLVTAVMAGRTMGKPIVSQIFDVGLYHTQVCAYVNDDLTGPCVENTWLNAGKNAMRTYLGDAPGANAFSQIAIGNGTVPVVGDTSLDSESLDGGLTNATGQYQANGANIANWTIGWQWTSTVTRTINTTMLFNGTGGTAFAGASFADANLNNGDKLTVNYTIWVT